MIKGVFYMVIFEDEDIYKKELEPSFFCVLADKCIKKNSRNCADCLKKLHKIPLKQSKNVNDSRSYIDE